MFPKERILDGRAVQSLVPIHRGFSLFVNGLLDAAVLPVMVLFLSDHRTLTLCGSLL